MDKLESEIIKILKHDTPLRAVKIAQRLGVERREINHYLYSSLKHLVIQDNDYKWSLKTNQLALSQDHPSILPLTPSVQSSDSLIQEQVYRLLKENIQQDKSIQPSINQAAPSPIKRKDNPYEFIQKELAQASAIEKIKIIEIAFSQDKFQELEDEDINALQSILEQAKREVDIAKNAYMQGQISHRKTKPFIIALVSVGITLGILVFFNKLIPQLSHQQSTPTLPQSR